ncbi:hypothetical protein AB833_30835 [Chromatiales bacterium (ex Bugula neritina AB1)]|nr:hypothetical protein AB833_30835 [Chromatiales bacterium (ex Bugula neritina AB1)]
MGSTSVLVQEEESHTGLLVFYPVYHQKKSDGKAGSGTFSRLRGFALLVLRLDYLVAEALIDSGVELSVHIVDNTEPGQQEHIFGDIKPNAQYAFSDTMDIAGRSWRVDTTVSSSAAPMQWASWLMLLGGLLFTALITAGLVHLIHRREVVESLVRRRTSELRMLSSIVANSNDSFMITDAREQDQTTGRRRIVYVNDSFTRQTGYSREEAVGDTPYLLHGLKTDKKLVQELSDSITQGVPFRGEFLYYKKNNDSYWVDVNVVPIKNEEGEISHYGAVQRDITDFKLARLERENLIGKLMDSNEELARFAYVCSHDLQEPLRMIRSFTDKLQSHIADDLVNDEKGRKYFGFITDGAERAQNLISDILAYSSVDNSTAKLERIDGMELIDNIKQLMAAALKDNGGRITHDALPYIQGNKTQLYQLFQNLINNALKYQKPDALPHVHFGVTDAGKYWQFSIKDNGIGIEQRHLAKIFDVFQRLHRRSEYSGTGVGLSICKKVVERHGGNLWVESEKGVGSIFHFTLLKPTLMEVNNERERKAS